MRRVASRTLASQHLTNDPSLAARAVLHRQQHDLRRRAWAVAPLVGGLRRRAVEQYVAGTGMDRHGAAKAFWRGVNVAGADGEAQIGRRAARAGALVTAGRRNALRHGGGGSET